MNRARGPAADVNGLVSTYYTLPTNCWLPRIRCSASAVLAVRLNVTDQRPWASGLTSQCGCTHDRLMDQLEAAFGLADGFDREGPQAGRAVERQADVDAEPFVDEVQRLRVGQIELPAELAQPVAAGRRGSSDRRRRTGRPEKFNSTAKCSGRSAGRFSSR